MVHSAFIVFSVITAFQQTQTGLLTALNFSLYLQFYNYICSCVALGKYYSVNVPLEDGVDDNAFLYVFKPIISKIMEIFDPGAVVLQCGADSLTGDRLGTFNVTLKGK